MNMELYESRMMEIILETGEVDREINDELVEVQVEIVNKLISNYRGSLADESISLGDIMNREVLKIVYKQIAELKRYTTQPEISEKIIDDANEAIKTAVDTLGEQCIGKIDEDKNYQEFKSTIKTLKIIVQAISEYIESSKELNTSTLDSKYELLKPKLEKSYNIKSKLTGKKAVEAEEVLKSLVNSIKDIKNKMAELKKSEKAIDTDKIQELEVLKVVVQKINNTTIDAENFKKIQREAVHSTNKLRSLLKYAKTLGVERKDSIHMRDYNFGGISIDDNIIWLTSTQFNFTVDIKHLLEYSISLENNIGRKMSELKVATSKEPVNTERLEINYLTLFNPIILTSAVYSCKIKKTSSLIDVNTLSTTDYFTGKIKEGLVKEGQQKITFGVFCRTYITKYMKDVNKYNMDSKSPILQNYLNALYKRLGVENK